MVAQAESSAMDGVIGTGHAAHTSDWTLKRVGLLAANIFCILYIVYLVAAPQQREAVGAPASQGSDNSSPESGPSSATDEPSAPTGAPSTDASDPSRAPSPPRKPQQGSGSSKKDKFVTTARGTLSDEQWTAYNKLGDDVFRTTFPKEEILTVTSDAMVWKRHRNIFDFLPCFGDDDMASNAPRYDVAFTPIGCFGDAPGPSCLTTSCYFGRGLANATFCGRKKFGAFLGDNFYPNGLKKENDPRFDKDLNAKFFRHGALRMRYYAMAGNHDKRPQTQIRKSGQHPYWYMPSLNYTGDLIRSGGTTVQVFVVDTHWGFDLNYPHMEEQAAWLDAELKASTATWKVVLSHEPVFCFADFDHSRSLMDFIHPVLVKHKVQLFVAAHVHGVMLHKVDGGYHQLTSAGFADNFHTHVKAKRPRGYYHLGRGATAVFFNETFADVVGFMPDASMIFSHRIPVSVDPRIEVTDVAKGDKNLFTNRHTCEALLPEVPKFCANYQQSG